MTDVNAGNDCGTFVSIVCLCRQCFWCVAHLCNACCGEQVRQPESVDRGVAAMLDREILVILTMSAPGQSEACMFSTFLLWEPESSAF